MTGRITEPELNRISVFLQSEDKCRRKRALEEIIKSILEVEPSWEVKDIGNVWENVHRSLVRLLNDPTEACRDQTLDILNKFLIILPNNEKNILYIMPILSKRLSSQELIESSEEVRLNCIKLLRLIVSKYKEQLPIYLDDFIKILMRTVADNYPDVKKESCQCITELAKSIPRQFYSQSEHLVKPVLSNFNHQQYKVRVAAVITIGIIVQYGHNKLMDEVSTPLAERLFDQSGAVRVAVVKVAGLWLLELKDRYSWWHKIIPLVMTGLHDELEDIRIKATQLWDAAGHQYIKENEEDEKLKNKMDFLSAKLEHYPPTLSRPNLGCRIIAQQNFCKLVNGIAVELGDWMPDIRVRSAQLLCVLVINVEENIIQHIEKLLPSMYRACNDEDKRVVQNVELAAEYMGYFVSPEVYCRLVLPTLEDSPSAGHLRVFAAILKGSETSTLSKHLTFIGKFLQSPDICRSRKPAYQHQLLHCCNSLLSVCKEECCQITSDLFTILFTTLSMAVNEHIEMEANRLLDMLLKFEGLENVNKLYLEYVKQLLLEIGGSKPIWTVYMAEFQIFQGCFVHATVAVGHNMGVILPILKNTIASQADPELRLKCLILLADYFQSGQESFQYIEYLEETIKSIVEDILIPGLIWSAGRAAEAIRTAAVNCLCSILQNDANPFMQRNDNEKEKTNILYNNENIKSIIFSNPESFLNILEKINPILITLVDDNAKKTRLYSLRAICLLMAIGQRLSCITEGHINQTYPVILKRLDDGCDIVRHAAIEALVEVWFNIPKDYNLVFNRSHIDALFTTMIIHLDDPEIKFQQLMLDALLCLSKVHPELLFQKLENSQNNFRNISSISKILNHCQGILKTDQKGFTCENTI